MNTTHATRAARGGGIRIAILLATAALAGGGVSFLFFGRHRADADPKHAAARVKPAPPAAPAVYVDMHSFLVNLICAEQLRYLKANITLVVRPRPDPEAKKAKKGLGEDKGPDAPSLSPADDMIARDVITRVLSEQRFEELCKGPPREAAKRLLTQELSKALKDCEVLNVLFTSFVMQ